MRVLTRLASVGLLATLSGPAAWARHGEHIRHRGMDRNRDGVITRDEWRGNDVSFSRHDRNRDGRLAGYEVRPGARRRDALSWERRRELRRFELERERRFELRRGESREFGRLDRNHDGVLERRELRRDPRLYRFDRNRDGVVTRDELWYRSRR